MPHTELYDILGVSPTATTQEINKAYRKLATQLHPDKNNSPDAKQQMSAVNEAREILIDDQKRKIYDSYGLEGLKNSCQEGDSDFSFDMLNMFFGGGRGGRRKRTTQMEVELTLEEMFTGCTKTERLRMKRVCSKCSGLGASSEHIQKCSSCHGEGKVLMRNGNMMIVQTCSSCGGEGRKIPRDKLCSVCSGSGRITQQVDIDYEVKKGAKDGERVIIKDMGELDASNSPTDLMIMFKTKPHKQFKRDGEDLLLDMEISVSESLTGFCRRIKTISGTDVLLTVPAGHYTPHGSYRHIKGHGMPFPQSPSRMGDLCIYFTVKYPQTQEVSVEVLSKIEKLLPSKPEVSKSNATPVTSELVMKSSKNRDSNQGSSRSRVFFSSDHDEQSDGDSVHFGGSQCQPS